jgi:large subunit ribosomal protein L25
MSVTPLAVFSRPETGKGPNRRLRAEGRVPAVVYGVGTDEPFNIAIEPRSVVNVLESKFGVNTILEILVDGKSTVKALIKDYQIHPVRRTLIHVDFMAVKDDVPVNVEIPVDFQGMSPLEKLGAMRRVLSRTVSVACLPSMIPEAIPFDMTGFERPVVCYASELTLPESVEPAYKRDFAIVTIRVRGAAQDEDEGEAAVAEEADAGEES